MRTAAANTKNKRASPFPESKPKGTKLLASFWIHHFFLKSWWVFLFIIISYSMYARAVEKKEYEKNSLKKKVEELKKDKQQALQLQQELSMQIASHKDPAWIEMTLMKGLGLVPEGQTKVFFVQKKLKQ